MSLANLALPLILVRLLSVHDVGEYKIFFLYVALAPALLLLSGVNNGLYLWAGKIKEKPQALQASWTLLLLGTLLWVGVGVGVSFTRWGQSAPVGPLWLVAAIASSLLAGFFEDCCIASGQIMRGALFAAAFDAFRVIVLLTVALRMPDVRAVVMAFTLTMGLKAVTGALMARRQGFAAWVPERALLADVLRYVFPVSLAAALAVAVNSADQVLLSTWLAPASFAVYSLGCLTVPPLLSFEQSVNRVLIPRLGQALTERRYSDAQSLYARAVGELFFLLLPAATGLSLFSAGIVDLLFTSKFAAAAIYLAVYAWCYLLYAIPYDAHARATGDGRWILRTFVKFALLSVVLTALWARFWGPMGALLGTLAAQLGLRLYSAFRARQTLRAKWTELIPGSDLFFYASVCAALSLGAWLVRDSFADARHWFLVCGPVFGAVYLAACYRRHRQRRILA